MAVTVILALAVFLGASGLVYYFFLFDRGSVYQRALDMARRGEYVDARSLVRARIDRDPENPRAHFYMSRIYAIEGNEDQERDHLEEIKRIGRYAGEEFRPAQVLVRIAQIAYELDQFEAAFENYLEALEHEPANETALAHVAFLSIGQGEFEYADRFFKRLIKAAPNVSEYHLARGVGLAMLRNKEALDELNLALSLSPRNQTAQFLTALQCFRENQAERARDLLEGLIPNLQDEYISYVASRLATAVFYLTQQYDKALSHAERCLNTAAKMEWDNEEYDARMAIAYMALLQGDLERANEHLLELEIRNPTDELVMKVSDFRMDLEEQVAQVDQISPRGFDFFAHMQDWLRNRFQEDAIYKLSGLKMSQEFDIKSFFTQEGQARPKREESGPQIDPDELIDRFNNLKGDSFVAACQSIMANLGFKMQSDLKYREKDGADFIATSIADKKVRALFRIRQWRNQPISDIFLRDQQNYMNELKVNQGFVVAGARLTQGAEKALENLKKITVVNDMAFAEILQKIL